MTSLHTTLPTFRHAVIFGMLCSLMATSTAVSATSNSIEPDSISQQILYQARAHLYALDDFSANFVYALFSSRITHPPIKGKISYKKQQINIQMGNQVIYCDAKTQWEYNTARGEVRIFDHNPFQGIALIFNIFLQGTMPTYLGKEDLRQEHCDIISLSGLPSDKYSSAKLWISENQHLPLRMILEDHHQAEFVFEFSDMMVNQQLPEELFKFELADHPNVIIIDERP